MDEYINREAAIRALLNDSPEQVSYSREDAADCIRYIDTADVAPVRHGRWEVKVGMNFFKERNCPVCKKRIESNFWNYCPNCGCMMDLEEAQNGKS